MTTIAWADETRNFAAGCEKVGPECTHCYAMLQSRRMPLMLGMDTLAGAMYEGVATSTSWTGIYRWDLVLMAIYEHEIKRSKKIKSWFLGSMSDLFHDAFRKYWAEFAGMLRRISEANPRQRLYILTKRAHNMLAFQREFFPEGFPACVWPGVTLGHDAFSDRVQPLWEVEAHGPRWLSMEPLLTHLDFHRDWCRLDRLGWVVLGAESGQKARPLIVERLQDMVRQLQGAYVPVFVKQIGRSPIITEWGQHRQKTLIHPKGGDPGEWPEDIRVREFPGGAP